MSVLGWYMTAFGAVCLLIAILSLIKTVDKMRDDK